MSLTPLTALFGRATSVVGLSFNNGVASFDMAILSVSAVGSMVGYVKIDGWGSNVSAVVGSKGNSGG